MHIPKAWAKAAGGAKTKEGGEIPLTAWGWGDDLASAAAAAAQRLERMIGRIRRGEPPPGYEYWGQPPREEILHAVGGSSAEPDTVVTRNHYGARVLNTARVLFLDVDFPKWTGMQRLRRFFSSSAPGPEEETLAKLRETLRNSRGRFRLYRTAAGLRAIAVDREYEPTGKEAQLLMQRTGTDPYFVRLCVAQKSFRARLTPKHWRFDHPAPPGRHPRTDPAEQAAFVAWLKDYESASAKYATCRFLETIGSGVSSEAAEKVIALHDKETRCAETLPLA